MGVLNYGCKTEVGSCRKSNQDFSAFVKNEYGEHLCIVCDGMGGHEHGDVASEMAVTAMVSMFKKQNFKELPESKIID